MCLQIVSIDLDFRLDLPFEVYIEDKLYELFRAASAADEDDWLRKALSRRLVDAITAMVDDDIPRPTEKQTKYALAIAQELNLELPPEVIRYRSAMNAFLTRHVRQFNESRASRIRRPRVAQAR